MQTPLADHIFLCKHGELCSTLLPFGGPSQTILHHLCFSSVAIHFSLISVKIVPIFSPFSHISDWSLSIFSCWTVISKLCSFFGKLSSELSAILCLSLLHWLISWLFYPLLIRGPLPLSFPSAHQLHWALFVSAQSTIIQPVVTPGHLFSPVYLLHACTGGSWSTICLLSPRQLWTVSGHFFSCSLFSGIHAPVFYRQCPV